MQALLVACQASGLVRLLIYLSPFSVGIGVFWSLGPAIAMPMLYTSNLNPLTKIQTNILQGTSR